MRIVALSDREQPIRTRRSTERLANPGVICMIRRIVGSCIAIAIASPVLLLAAPAHAAAQKYGLVGPAANISCEALDPVESEDSSQRLSGFVVFNDGEGSITAVVSVKRATPNTALPVRLIQSGSVDCWDMDGVLRTNGQGNGTLRIKEPVTGTHAQIIIDTRELFSTPTYRATSIYRI